jgi:hypothetical protein
VKRISFQAFFCTATATTLAACANLPAPPTVSHAPSARDVTLVTEGGLTRTLTVTVPYDANCTQFSRYTKSYVQNFVGGYVLEWNKQVYLSANEGADAARKKALKSSALKPPSSEPIDTSPMGMQEDNCMSGALSAQSLGGVQAHNDLVAHPPVP